MASHKENDIQVLVPYSALVALMDAPKRIAEQDKVIKHHERMIGALRGQLIEVIEKLKEK